MRDRIACDFAVLGRSVAAAIAPKKKNERREERSPAEPTSVSDAFVIGSSSSEGGSDASGVVEVRIRMSSPSKKRCIRDCEKWRCFHAADVSRITTMDGCFSPDDPSMVFRLTT
jgi:hypothetical protein